MQNLKKYSLVAIVTLATIVGIFNSSSYAQENQTTTTPMTNTTHTEQESGGEHATETATPSSDEGETNDNKTGVPTRDSALVLLQDTMIPAGDFLHLPFCLLHLDILSC